MNQLAKIVSRYHLSGNICKLISKCINISIIEPEIINMANIELLSGQILGKIPHGMYTYKNLYECIDKVLKNTKEQYYVIYLNNEQLNTNMYYEYNNYYVKTAQIHNNVIFDLINVNCDVIRIVNVAACICSNINPEIVRVFDTTKFSSIDDQDYVMISDLLDVTRIYEEEQYNMQLQKDIDSGVANEANEYLQDYLNNTGVKINYDLKDQLYYSPDKRFKTLKELCNIRKKMIFKDWYKKEYRAVKAPVIMKFKKKHKCSVCEKIDSNILICSRCKNTYYCSTKCQRIDYPNHKTICRSHMKNIKIAAPQPYTFAGDSSW